MEDTLNYIERTGNLLRSEMRKMASTHDLQFVHAEILDYLSRCNKYSNTPLALTEFLGQTKGTVSQSLKLLIEKKLVSRTKDDKDGRVIRLSLTKKGEDIISDIQKNLPRFPETTNEKELGILNDSLKESLRQMQIESGHKSFGLCTSCRYNIKKKGSRFECGLTGEALTVNDTKKICREHAYQD